ncbi:alkene reductase [Nocardioides cavernae]|uniref:Alkene reductase n=1 Tax=Nocardioides cavernae TaxID=1921566 RepID=A0ABR8NCT0_9ACTN|nr:alkene reductase [Nocardioides cavernae]
MAATESAERLLLKPYTLRGGIELENRVVMAPMTRARASEPDGIPSPEAATYYSQRAGAGLVVTEATNISLHGKGFGQTPGCYTDQQEAAWADVADAVHSRGGCIFMQHWHVGRLASRETCGDVPLAPSQQTAPARVWAVRSDGWKGAVPCDEAREMTVSDIRQVVNEHRDAAVRAVRAGFDGVELHGANGYLIDQFLRSTTNKRQDDYGGSPTARCRFLSEVVDAVVDAIGAKRVGVRLSPRIGYADGADPEMETTTLLAASVLEGKGIAYLHVAEADSLADDLEPLSEEFRADLRERFTGPLIVAHQYDVNRGEAALASGLADLVAFGRPFLANPDLVDRIAHGVPWAPTPEKKFWYSGEDSGYIDWPTSELPDGLNGRILDEASIAEVQASSRTMGS